MIETKRDTTKAQYRLQQKWANLTNLHHATHLPAGSHNAENRIKYWGRTGAYWGGILGLLSGPMLVFVPHGGPLLITGPLACCLFLGMAGAMVVGGLSAFEAGIYNLGMAHDSILLSAKPKII